MQFDQINFGDVLARKVTSLVTDYCGFLRNIVLRTLCTLFSQFYLFVEGGCLLVSQLHSPK